MKISLWTRMSLSALLTWLLEQSMYRMPLPSNLSSSPLLSSSQHSPSYLHRSLALRCWVSLHPPISTCWYSWAKVVMESEDLKQWSHFFHFLCNCLWHCFLLLEFENWLQLKWVHCYVSLVRLSGRTPSTLNSWKVHSSVSTAKLWSKMSSSNSNTRR